MIADASRYQLAARADRSATPRRSSCSATTRDTSIDYLLALDGELSEHLVDPDDVRRLRRRAAAAVRGRRWPPSTARPTASATRRRHAIDRRAELLGLVEAYRGLKRHLGLMDFSDQIALAARLAERVPRGRRARARASTASCCSTSTRTPRSPRR